MKNEHTEASMTQELRRLAEDFLTATGMNERLQARFRFEDAANPAAILELLDRLEKAEKDAARLVWAMHNMSNPFGRHEFGFSQHVLEQGSTGDINDCRTYIDAAMEASK